MDEEALAGGNMEPVVRIGDTVRRVTGPWTAGVHELLRRYEGAGIVEAPRPLGIDEHGREILTYLSGEVMTTTPEQLWSLPLLRAAGRLLRRLHDASTPLVGAEFAWRQPTREPVEVICHNDFAPYNLIIDGDRLIGVIDFDMASPGSRLWDIAYLAYRLVPYAEDAHGFDPGRDGSRADRLRELLAAYGVGYPDDEVRRIVAQRLDALAEFTEDRAATTGRADLAAHAEMYRRDARRLTRRESL
ncbi:MAG: phosphotransferase [Tessaracoccus sp.]|uniref:phosphotransferase n=1 Tax=Tessaracoccus sp. TaxID=1971211 RepID=UPI001EB10974|nr:phosphotransferase [Tessaracoccus sp.]MBK7822896.1 phosphotransferase [Tessaracoccus sp.]